LNSRLAASFPCISLRVRDRALHGFPWHHPRPHRFPENANSGLEQDPEMAALLAQFKQAGSGDAFGTESW